LELLKEKKAICSINQGVDQDEKGETRRPSPAHASA